MSNSVQRMKMSDNMQRSKDQKEKCILETRLDQVGTVEYANSISMTGMDCGEKKGELKSVLFPIPQLV
jgi:hypothetical protein